MTTLTALDDLSLADDAVPFGPLTFVQATTRDGYAAIARLHDEALAAIAALAGGDQPATEAQVLRMGDRPAVASRAWGMAAA